MSPPVLLAVGLGPGLANGTNRVAVLAGAIIVGEVAQLVLTRMRL